MKYREFLNKMSDTDLAEVLVDDSIFNMACAECDFLVNKNCSHTKCIQAVTKLLQSEMELN